jgi:hypothetical protein
MNKILKLSALTLVLVLGSLGGGRVNAQVLQKGPGTAGPVADSKHLPKDKNTTHLDKASPWQIDIKPGVNGKEVRAPNSVLRESKDSVRLPDSRLPAKEAPARGTDVLRKLVL